ncbi:hypothetical protein MNBD_GAMMA08-1558 [hydrothermal vent metagenome]|uniref:Uncharacterized protein n=1 Tax=hydrothermal vent metagenome TaxID=652676 RepID=A0A3B0X4I9_9ZZZZ
MTNHNNEFNAFMIRYITRLYNDHDYASLKRMNVKPDLAKEIANMSVGNSERLSNFNSLICDLPAFDEPRFAMLIKYIHREDAKSDIIDRMVKLEASQVMLYKLAAVDRDEYRDRRIKLGLPQASSGRPATITEEQTARLHEALHIHENEPDKLLRYFKVGVASRIPLSQIWHYMNSSSTNYETTEQ